MEVTRHVWLLEMDLKPCKVDTTDWPTWLQPLAIAVDAHVGELIDLLHLSIKECKFSCVRQSRLFKKLR